jgi:hypothetical protein
MMNLLKKLIPDGKDHTLDVPKYEGDIANIQIVALENPSSDNERVRVMSPSPVMSKEQALVHAAWLVAVADSSENFEEFRRVLRAVLET